MLLLLYVCMYMEAFACTIGTASRQNSNHRLREPCAGRIAVYAIAGEHLDEAQRTWMCALVDLPSAELHWLQ